MVLPSHNVRCVVLVIIMLCSHSLRSLHYEEQTRQSWQRIHRLQQQGMICQIVAILLLTTDTLQQPGDLFRSQATDQLQMLR